MIHMSFCCKVGTPRQIAVTPNPSILPNPETWRVLFEQLVSFNNLPAEAEIRKWVEPLAADGYYLYPPQRQ